MAIKISYGTVSMVTILSDIGLDPKSVQLIKHNDLTLKGNNDNLEIFNAAGEKEAVIPFKTGVLTLAKNGTLGHFAKTLLCQHVKSALESMDLNHDLPDEPFIEEPLKDSKDVKPTPQVKPKLTNKFKPKLTDKVKFVKLESSPDVEKSLEDSENPQAAVSELGKVIDSLGIKDTGEVPELKKSAVCKLKDAKELYQRVSGTSPNSRYTVFGLSKGANAVVLATRWISDTGTLSIRVEGKGQDTLPPVVANKLQSMNFNTHNGAYASVHLSVKDSTVVAQTLGSILFGLQMTFQKAIQGADVFKMVGEP